MKLTMKMMMILILCSASLLSAGDSFKLGVDVFLSESYKAYEGKAIGLITNATGITSDNVRTIDAFYNHPGIQLTALFGPEHGIRGDETAGGTIDDQIDIKTGLPVFSLYGKNRKPTAEMLQNIDVLIYDIQDIGNRTYTYIYTMAYAMEAAAEHHIEFVVLDRPIPMFGQTVDGNILDEKFSSFIGRYAIPYVYGMTPGELAGYFNQEYHIDAKLTVIKMAAYHHSMGWEDTGLAWIPTSPHIPRYESAYFCAATGCLGEMHTVCVGIGYTLPFEVLGETWIDGDSLAAELNSRHLPGVLFRPIYFKPYYGTFQNKACSGVQLILSDEHLFLPFTTQVHILEALQKLYPESNFLKNKRRLRSFDRAAGTDRLRKEILKGKSAVEILAGYQKSLNPFRARRQQYLLYDETLKK